MTIQIKTNFRTKMSSKEIGEYILDTNQWSKFRGYAIIPGIKKAIFEIRTNEIVGSKIRVISDDNSSYIEEIIEWDIFNRIALKFTDFSPPLKYLASHFIETIEFQVVSDETKISRMITMYPKGILGWLILTPISKLMKRALIKHMAIIYSK